MKNCKLHLLLFILLSMSDRAHCSYKNDVMYEAKNVLINYVDQNLSDSQLVNCGIIIKKLEQDNLAVSIYDKQIELEADYKLDSAQKKAILMAICRLNSSGRPFFKQSSWIQSGFKIYSMAKHGIWYFDRVIWNKNFYDYSEGNGISFVTEYEDDDNDGFNIKKIDDYKLVFPEMSLMSVNGCSYSEELINIIRKLVKDEYSDAINLDDNSIHDWNADFTKYVIETTIIDSAELLSRKFDFIKKLWNESISITVKFPRFEDNNSSDIENINPEFKVSMIIQGNKLNSFLVALMRLKVKVDRFFDLYPYNIVSDGPIYSFDFTVGNNTRYLLYIRDYEPYIGLVGVSRLRSLNDDSNTKDNDSISSVISEGVFYSPELYRIVVSFFSDIARQEFLDKKSDVN